MIPPFLLSSSFGTLLGMRHALEPDHLAAVSTLVSRERNGLKAMLLGVCWGLGHTLALVVVGTALILLARLVCDVGRERQSSMRLDQRNSVAGKLQCEKFAMALADRHINAVGKSQARAGRR